MPLKGCDRRRTHAIRCRNCRPNFPPSSPVKPIPKRSSWSRRPCKARGRYAREKKGLTIGSHATAVRALVRQPKRGVALTGKWAPPDGDLNVPKSEDRAGEIGRAHV